MGVTPVPIPNTMVKTQAADGTALETVWESRWPPNLKAKHGDGNAVEVHIDTGRRAALLPAAPTPPAGHCC